MLRDLGNAIKTFCSIAPQTIGTGSTVVTAEGVGIDRIGYEWAVFSFNNAAPSGTPDGITVTCKVQESSDNDVFTDITGATSSHNITSTFVNTKISVDLSGVKKYVRGAVTVVFNGGSGPITVIEATGILGSAREYPAT